MRIKNIFIFGCLGLIGCSSISTTYILDVDALSLTQKNSIKTQIAVDKVSVPGYMKDGHIGIKNDDGSITHTDEMWAVPTEKALTDALIRGLQIKFDNPNVKRYPWDVENDRGIRVKVDIRHFLYEDGMLNLEANYSIGSIKALTPRGYRYVVSLPAEKTSADIVKVMNREFSYLLNDIGAKIN